MFEELCSVFCYKMWIVQSETFCDGSCLRNKLDLQSFGDAFSLKNWWSEKYVLFVQCIHVLILIKRQILLYILLENLKLHCNLHEKLAQDLFVPWELDSLGMKLFILQTLALAFCGIWLLTTASWSVNEQRSIPCFFIFIVTHENSASSLNSGE